MTVQWGREIEVNGVRPAWLGDEEIIRAFGVQGREFIPARSAWAHGWSKETVAIRLPADHFAYAALDAGFEPWAGGNNPPADWDGGLVLLRQRGIRDAGNAAGIQGCRWNHSSDAISGRWDIIGYRKCSPAKQPDADTVTIARRTEAEWLKLYPDNPCVMGVIRAYGLIRPETPLDRFTRETGHVVTDDNRAVVEAALEWSAKA